MQLQQEKRFSKTNLLRKCGLLALNLANIFEKLLDQKTFCLPAARILQPIIYLLDESKWLPVIQIPTQLTVRQQPLAIPL